MGQTLSPKVETGDNILKGSPSSYEVNAWKTEKDVEQWSQIGFKEASLEIWIMELKKYSLNETLTNQLPFYTVKYLYY